MHLAQESSARCCLLRSRPRALLLVPARLVQLRNGRRRHKSTCVQSTDVPNGACVRLRMWIEAPVWHAARFGSSSSKHLPAKQGCSMRTADLTRSNVVAKDCPDRLAHVIALQLRCAVALLVRRGCADQAGLLCARSAFRQQIASKYCDQRATAAGLLPSHPASTLQRKVWHVSLHMNCMA